MPITVDGVTDMAEADKAGASAKALAAKPIKNSRFIQSSSRYFGSIIREHLSRAMVPLLKNLLAD